MANGLRWLHEFFSLLKQDPSKVYTGDNDVFEKHPFGVAIKKACAFCSISTDEIFQWASMVFNNFVQHNFAYMPTEYWSQLEGVSTEHITTASERTVMDNIKQMEKDIHAVTQVTVKGKYFLFSILYFIITHFKSL